MNPLEQLAAEDVLARERVLDGLRHWCRTNAAHYDGCSLVLHGSLARGDYWVDGDADLLLEGGDTASRAALESAFRSWWSANYPRVTLDIWPLDTTIAAFNGRALADRALPAPIQFGLYAFDVARHHVVLLGHDFLAPLQSTSGNDLLFLAKDRLRKLATPGETGYGDTPPKKAMEALKAAAIILSVLSGRAPPSRDKRSVLTTFLSGTAAMQIPDGIAVQAWSAYRYGTEPPPKESLLRFVSDVAACFR